jgi:hypothetical protein
MTNGRTRNELDTKQKALQHLNTFHPKKPIPCVVKMTYEGRMIRPQRLQPADELRIKYKRFQLIVAEYVKKLLQHFNTSTLQHFNTSTLQHLNTSTPQHFNTFFYPKKPIPCAMSPASKGIMKSIINSIRSIQKIDFGISTSSFAGPLLFLIKKTVG